MIVRKQSLLISLIVSFISLSAFSKESNLKSVLQYKPAAKSKAFSQVSLGMGIKNIKYAENFEGNFPSVNMDLESDSFGVMGTYTFASTYNLAKDLGEETKVNTLMASAYYKYNIGTYRVEPKLTAVYIDLQKADLTNYSGNRAQVNSLFDDIEDRTGFYPGIRFAKKIDVWELSIDADFGFSYGLNISYSI